MKISQAIARALAGALICAQVGGSNLPAAQASPLADTADLDISIAAADTTVEIPGEDIQYNITVVNNGPDAATNVQVTFSINYITYQGTIVGGSTAAGWSCMTALDARSRTCSTPVLGAGETALLGVVVQPLLTGVFVGEWVSAVVSSSAEDPVGSNNAASPGNVTVTTNATHADAVAEVNGYYQESGYVMQAQRGSRVRLVYGARNAGTPIAGYTATLDVPGGGTLMSTYAYEHTCEDAVSQSVCAHVPAAPAGPGVYPPIGAYMLVPDTPGVHSSTITARSWLIDPIPSNDVIQAPITVTSAISKADLKVLTATVDSPGFPTQPNIYPGASAFYVVGVANDGPSDAVNTDVIIPLFQNSDPELGNWPAYPAIKYAPAGWTCSYYVYGRLIVCKTPNFRSGAHAEFLISFAAGQIPGTYRDMPIIGSDSGDPDTSNNSMLATLTIAPNMPGNTARLHTKAQHQTGQVPLPSGTRTSVVFTVTNDGPDKAIHPIFETSWAHYGRAWDFAGVSAPGWTCFSFIGYSHSMRCARDLMLVNEVSVLTFTLDAPMVTATDDLRVCGLITSETANDYPTYFGPKTKFACDTYYVTPLQANIRVEGRDSPDPVNAGGTLTYFVSVHNAGPDNQVNGFYRTLNLDVAPGVAFQQLIGPSGWSAIYTIGGAWQFYFPRLAAGASSTATIIVAAPSITGSIAATATVRGSDFDVDLSDNTTVIRTRVSLGEDAADLRPEIYPLADFEACIASTVPITAVTANLGPDVAEGLRMTITSSGPDTLSTVSAGCVSLDGLTLACSAATLDAGQNFTALVNVTVAGTTPSTITVASSSNTPDGNGDDNTVIRVIRPVDCSTATPTPTHTPTPTQTPTSAPSTATHTPTATATPTATGAPPTATHTPTATATPTATGAPPTATHTPTATATSTATDTPPTATATPTATSTGGGGRTPRGFLPLVVR